jgi:hypothetical protein
LWYKLMLAAASTTKNVQTFSMIGTPKETRPARQNLGPMADGTQDTWVLEDSMTQSQLHTQPDDLGVSAAVDSEPEGAEPDLEEQDDTETPTQPFVMELPDDSDDSEQDEPGKSATGDKSSLETAEVVVKKPQSAYFLFVAARRDAVKEANPGWGGIVKLSFVNYRDCRRACA